MTDQLTDLARAITDAQDALDSAEHTDDCQRLTGLDQERGELVERIEARESRLDAARERMQGHFTAGGVVSHKVTETYAPYQTLPVRIADDPFNN